MIAKGGPKLYEYNVRFGDPECQVLMMRLKSGLAAALLATADGVLDTFDLRWHEDAALTVVMAAKGYPGDYAKDTEIRGGCGGGGTRAVRGWKIFHAGTRRGDGNPHALAAGGRVRHHGSAARRSPGAGPRLRGRCAPSIGPSGFYRTADIGWRAVARAWEKGAP
jgi:phosphoribosylamine--glycine ligase